MCVGEKNLQPLDVETSQAVSERLVHAIDRWADHVEMHLTMEPIFSALGVRENEVIRVKRNQDRS